MAPTADPGAAVQHVAYAGLDALRDAVDLDLCAYLHAVTGTGPQLYLRAPDLSSMDATQAFDLFSALRDLLTADRDGVRDVRVGMYEAIAVRTRGTSSEGLFVAGRAGDQLDPRGRALVAGVCAALGAACQAVEDAGRAAPAPDRQAVRVATEMDEAVATAHVVVRAGDETFEGDAEGSSTAAAVADATLAAIGGDLKIAGISDGEVGGERAVIAVVHDGAGRTEVAAALGGADPLRAVASAVLEAAARLGY